MRPTSRLLTTALMVIATLTGAAAQEPAPPVYAPGNGVSLPVVIKQVPPQYTQEAKDAGRVVAQDERRRSGAENTKPVENDDRPVVRERRNGRIVAVATGRPHGIHVGCAAPKCNAVRMDAHRLF